jgi:hypothetical protein
VKTPEVNLELTEEEPISIEKFREMKQSMEKLPEIPLQRFKKEAHPEPKRKLSPMLEPGEK